MNTADSLINRSLLAELWADHSINIASVHLDTDGGVVSITGQVESDAEKWLINEAAVNFAGVVRVNDRLAVVIPHRETSTDDEICHECEKALETSIPGPNEGIRVMVANGWVTLTGQVAWGYERWATEAVVGSLRGVAGVNCRISISPLDLGCDSRTNHRGRYVP